MNFLVEWERKLLSSVIKNFRNGCLHTLDKFLVSLSLNFSRCEAIRGCIHGWRLDILSGVEGGNWSWSYTALEAQFNKFSRLIRLIFAVVFEESPHEGEGRVHFFRRSFIQTETFWSFQLIVTLFNAHPKANWIKFDELLQRQRLEGFWIILTLSIININYDMCTLDASTLASV